MKKNLKSILFYALFVVLTVAIILFVMSGMKGEAKKTIDLENMFKNGEVVSFKWDQYNDTLTVTDKAKNTLTFAGISEEVYMTQIFPLVEQINGSIEAYPKYEQALKDYEAALG